MSSELVESLGKFVGLMVIVGGGGMLWGLWEKRRDKREREDQDVAREEERAYMDQVLYKARERGRARARAEKP